MPRSQPNSSGLKWVAAHVGARMHYAVPEILYVSQKLYLFFTDTYFHDGLIARFLLKLPYLGLLKKYITRRSSYLPDNKVVSFLFMGVRYFLKSSQCKTTECSYKVFVWAGKAFNSRILMELKTKSDGFDAIYSFNSASLELFKKYKRRKLLVLEQCIAPYSTEYSLLTSEREVHPGWTTMGDDLSYITEYIRREEKEIKLADAIICPSDFVKKSIIGTDPKLEDKIHVVPYGVRMQPKKAKIFTTGGPVRVLSVGKAGLRKGTPYVLHAAKSLQGKAEFRWVGDYGGISPEKVAELKAYMDMKGQVSRHEISEHYEWADIFLLPSVCEGSATVTYEAMQYGLPMIVTDNTGSIIRNGVDGFIVSLSNPEEIINCILKFCEDRTLLDSFSGNVTNLSIEGTYSAYSNRLLAALKHIETKWQKQVQ